MAFKRGFFLIIGLCSLLLGIVGIALPLLPTVPFILLAAFCFARSSQRLHQWLMAHPWFADALNNWQQQGAIRKGLKRKAMLVTGISFLVSISLVPLLWVKFVLLGLALVLLTFMWRIPELNDQ